MQVSEQFTKIVRALAMAAVIICLTMLAIPPGHVGAQSAGVVGIQSQMIPVFNAQTATKCSSIFQDIGQGSNLLFITSASGGTATFDLEWSPTGSAPFYPIVVANYNDSTGQTHTLPLNSYFPNLRSCLTYTTGTWSAWYTASSGPVGFTTNAIGSNGPATPIVCDQDSTASVTTGSTVSLLGAVNFTAGTTTVICGLYVSFNGTPTGGSVELGWAASDACSAIANGWQAFTNSSAVDRQMNFQARGPGNITQQPCFANTSGVTALVSYSYATVKI